MLRVHAHPTGRCGCRSSRGDGSQLAFPSILLPPGHATFLRANPARSDEPANDADGHGCEPSRQAASPAQHVCARPQPIPELPLCHAAPAREARRAGSHRQQWRGKCSSSPLWNALFPADLGAEQTAESVTRKYHAKERPCRARKLRSRIQRISCEPRKQMKAWERGTRSLKRGKSSTHCNITCTFAMPLVAFRVCPLLSSGLSHSESISALDDAIWVKVMTSCQLFQLPLSNRKVE
mmetsp:Transcript_43512/g.137625  ORF Transcript_43512/g.137625 Transcript_43512/m.137625 type:complete len:237 (-) Transcript_43512:36-746(-)